MWPQTCKPLPLTGNRSLVAAPAKYLEDQKLTGRRLVEEEDSEDEDDTSDVESASDDESSNEDTDADRKPPANMPPKKLPKSPPALKGSTPRKVKKADEVDSLSQLLSGIEFKTKEGASFIVDRNQAYPYMVWSAKDRRNRLFCHVRLVLSSDVTPKMISCKIAADGLSVQVTVKKPPIGALTDPIFLLIKYEPENNGVDETHPVYSALQSAQRAYTEDKDYLEQVVNVKLLFACDPAGFYDPVSKYQNDKDRGIHLGLYPLDPLNHLDGQPLTDEQCTNLLTFACMELKGETLRQPVQATSFLKKPAATSTASLIND